VLLFTLALALLQHPVMGMDIIATHTIMVIGTTAGTATRTTFMAATGTASIIDSSLNFQANFQFNR